MGRLFAIHLTAALVMAGTAHAQPAPSVGASAGKRQPAPVTPKKADEIRTGEAKPGQAAQKAGEGTFGESRTNGSLAPRPTQPTPTGQPPQ